MRLQLVNDDQGPSVRFADLDGDGIDDETGEPVEEPVEEPADDDDEPEAEAPPEDMAATRRWVLAVEDVETGDGRRFEPGAITWRDLPLPFMATDETDDGHDGAKLVSNIVSIERDGNTIYAETVHIDSSDTDVLRLQKLIDDGDLRGVSVDLDSIEGTMTISEDGDVVENEDGSIDVPMSMPKMNISAGRIMGATAVPFPAFAEAQQLRAALVAGAGSFDQSQSGLTAAAAITAPDAPPMAWFNDPQLDGPTRLTVTDIGQVFGHLAVWDSCHIGFQDRCVRPPRSESSYSTFHTGEILTAEGSRVQVGQITADSGHAALNKNARLAAEHYDNTGWAAADVRCGEDQYGIWIAGALRSDISDAQLRTVMASDVSGDWRKVGNALDLVGIASVNVPGFSKAQFAGGDRVALVASIPPCDASDVTPGYAATRELIASTIGRSRAQRDAERDRVAWSIGRHPSQLREALAVAVHGS